MSPTFDHTRGTSLFRTDVFDREESERRVRGTREKVLSTVGYSGWQKNYKEESNRAPEEEWMIQVLF